MKTAKQIRIMMNVLDRKNIVLGTKAVYWLEALAWVLDERSGYI